MSVISTINANLFSWQIFVRSSTRSLLTVLRCHGDRKCDFLVFCEVGPTLRDFISHSLSLQSCTMHEAPQWNFTSRNEFISSSPYILFCNAVFLTDLPVSVSEIEKITYYCYYLNLLRLGWLVAGLLCQEPGFEGGPSRLGFEKDKVVLRQVFLSVLQFSPVSIIPPLLHIHSFIYHRHCIMFFSRYFSFSLSVSFHHCSILIHPSATHVV